MHLRIVCSFCCPLGTGVFQAISFFYGGHLSLVVYGVPFQPRRMLMVVCLGLFFYFLFLFLARHSAFSAVQTHSRLPNSATYMGHPTLCLEFPNKRSVRDTKPLWVALVTYSRVPAGMFRYSTFC